MNKQYSKEFVKEHLDCYYKQSKKLMPLAQNELKRLGSELSLKDILKSKVRLQDKYWWLLAHTDITIDELKELSIKIADISVKMYEEYYPDDARLKDAVSKAKNGIDTSDDIKKIIQENNSNDAMGNTIKASARAIKTLFTSGHKRPLTIKAVHRLIAAAKGNENHISLLKKLLKEYE
jgi:hypothetical protein